MVHPRGFEPLTTRFVAEYSIQLSYGCTKLGGIDCPENGASERIRTSDHSVRSRVLYPTELRMHYAMAVREGFEPSMRLLTACSLSRGVPSASRPPHRCGCRYYCAGKICQTFFPPQLTVRTAIRQIAHAACERPFRRRTMRQNHGEKP